MSTNSLKYISHSNSLLILTSFDLLLTWIPFTFDFSGKCACLISLQTWIRTLVHQPVTLKTTNMPDVSLKVRFHNKEENGMGFPGFLTQLKELSDSFALCVPPDLAHPWRPPPWLTFTSFKFGEPLSKSLFERLFQVPHILWWF